MEVDKSSDSALEGHNTLPHSFTASRLHWRRGHIHNSMERPEQILIEDEQVRVRLDSINDQGTDGLCLISDIIAGALQKHL